MTPANAGVIIKGQMNGGKEMDEQIIFEIILHGGNARAEAYEALRAAEEGDFDRAEEHMERADKEVGMAHRIQTDIIQQEVQGTKYDLTVLFVHAQDHLMTAVAEKTLIESMVKMHRRIKMLEEKSVR
jgi:PTS system cellobiose-specific IIA component